MNPVVEEMYITAKHYPHLDCQVKVAFCSSTIWQAYRFKWHFKYFVNLLVYKTIGW